MPEPTARISPLGVLETGLAQYRRTARRELWRYYLSSGPFVLLLLWSWRQVATRRTAALPWMALGLAVTYTARTLGSGAYIRRALAAYAGSAPAGPRAEFKRVAAEIWRRAALLLLWVVLAPCVIFTAPLYVAAHYAPLSGDTRRPLRGCLRWAASWYVQEWGLLALLGLMALLLLINLLLLAFILPVLLHFLLGITNLLTMAGGARDLLDNSSFWVGLLLATYLALDPVTQCALAVSFYNLQAERDGADLLAGLGRLQTANPAARSRRALGGSPC